jgi:phage terminase large subunit-like protein
VWRTDAIEVDHPLSRSSPTVEIIGYQGDIEGERYDWALGDDIATFENAKTPYAREQQWMWMTGTLLRRLTADRRFYVYIGTPHWGGDLLDRIKADATAKGTWDYRETPAILRGTWPPQRKDPAQEYSKDNVIVPRDCEVLWPEFWSIEKLVEDFVEDQGAFARTRMLQHQDPESKWFTHSLVEDMKADGGIRLSDGSPRPLLSRWPLDVGIPGPDTALYEMYMSQGISPSALRLVISVDLATEEATLERANPDYTVLQLWGMDPATYARILLNQARRRMRDPKDIGQMLSEWVHVYNPDKLLVEAVAVDRLFARTLQDVVGFPVQIADPKKDKLDRIERLRDLIQAGMVWVPFANDTFRGNSGRNYNTRFVMQPFLDELEAYPRGNAHNDTLMAAVHAITELRGGDRQIKARLLGQSSEGDLPRGIPSVRTLLRRRAQGATGRSLDAQLAEMRRSVSQLKMLQVTTGGEEESEQQEEDATEAGALPGGAL